MKGQKQDCSQLLVSSHSDRRQELVNRRLYVLLYVPNQVAEAVNL
jgi:hypothetical protein